MTPVLFLPPQWRYADAGGAAFCSCEQFQRHLCKCGAKRLKWISHWWVIRSEWLIGHPYPSASSLLDDFLPVYLTWLSSSRHFFAPFSSSSVSISFLSLILLSNFTPPLTILPPSLALLSFLPSVSSLLFLFPPFIAITSPYIPLLFDFLINFQ